MITSKETQFCRDVMYILGRAEKLKLLKYSNLTNRERKIMTLRFVIGLSAKETADTLNMDLDTFNQQQKKIYIKIYKWFEFEYYKHKNKNNSKRQFQS